MTAPGLIHIVNFIRGTEPRLPMNLIEATREELKLVLELGLPATWLFQYDALINPEFTDLFRDLPKNQDLGLWFEFPQQLVEKAGLEWRGRYSWDWHAHVGFAIGYSPEDRRRMADIAVTEFESQFGYTPIAGGSWLLDAPLLEHLADKHGFAAFCNCKDQWGTDGYSLWGGYWNGPYFPSRKNAFIPAQTSENQIHVPVYRMLGSDPIYQYDCGAAHPGAQGVVTLEPVYAKGGGDPEWVRWFFDTMFTTPALTSGYAQAGQENSFGWDAVGPGYSDQLRLISEWKEKGLLTVETMSGTGKKFSSSHELTPASAVTALNDWQKEGRSSVWYNSRFYRANIFRSPQGEVVIRDFRYFDENYAERYLSDICATERAIYDAPPIADGLLWSGVFESGGTAEAAGIYLTDIAGQAIVTSEWSVSEADAETLVLKTTDAEGSLLQITFKPDSVGFFSEKPFALNWLWSDSASIMPEISIASDRINYQYEGLAYSLLVEQGMISTTVIKPAVLSTDGRISLCLATGSNQ